MQDETGKMRQVENTEIDTLIKNGSGRKILNINHYFKIKDCYFKIVEFTTDGINAKGVTREEYYASKRRF